MTSQTTPSSKFESAKERRAMILQELKTGSKVSVEDICRRFGVSEVTVRKDLDILQGRGLLVRVRGGAIRLPETEGHNNADTPISHKRLYNLREKRAIGRLAASLIKEGETIMIDSGTTTLEIARNLHAFRKLTVITNAVNVGLELLGYKRFNVILLGGHLRETSQSTVGPLAESNLGVFYCDKLFLGVDSFNVETGLSTPNIEEAHINQRMLTMARETIAVFDSSKFDKRSFAFIAPVESIHTVVTDSGIPAGVSADLRSRSLRVCIAGTE
ncbi:MAG: DeoR/GlpR family DNA-binding transcription regulator [Alistipes sp.]|jgi:DeoR/GlpR family transcriptional regulator of sugar metabolism|nr:DeoR/GlpR family DNA-binding transcription regulator [Alistipes sp.]